MFCSVSVSVFLAFVLLPVAEATTDELFDGSFDGWLALHKKSYVSKEEYVRKLAVWEANSVHVRHHNEAYDSGLTTYQMTMASPFADMTSEEFTNSYLMEPQYCSATSSLSAPKKLKKDGDSVSIPKYVDWRTKGIMTKVKNQGGCGSCWTFSTTGCLEAHYCLQHGLDCTHWKGLAEQQLVDCAGDFNNFGCNGGLPSQAFEYIKYNGGLDLETSYDYHAENGTCIATEGKVGAEVAEVFNITEYDEDDLEYAVAKIGPVSVAYQVSSDFRLYSHGVYDSYDAKTNGTICEDKPESVNHAVVAVGLGETETGVPFYIIRNSWGTSWGMEGHFWIKRGENLCGISDCASFPIVPTKKRKGGLRSDLISEVMLG